MERDQRTAGGQGKGAVVGVGVVRLGLEGQIQHRQGQHHLGEIRDRLGEGFGEKGRLCVAQGVILPEPVHRDEIGVLRSDGQMVIIVLGPFLCFIELSEKKAGPFDGPPAAPVF